MHWLNVLVGGFNSMLWGVVAAKCSSNAIVNDLYSPGKRSFLISPWCFSICISVFGYLLAHSPRFSPPCCSCLLPALLLVTGTIRKAQNLLKQYSQHGLDGKKGGSGLGVLEGKCTSFPDYHTSYSCFESKMELMAGTRMTSAHDVILERTCKLS